MALFDVENLSFNYPGQGGEVLKDVSFSIEAGEFIALCGKSGCGKSTLIRHFKTAILPFGKRSGRILYKGQPLENVDARTQAAEIGYVTQNPDNQIVTDKVWHEMAFGLENLGLDQRSMRIRVAEMASYFGIQNWFEKNVTELSGRQKQILNLASIMAMHPEILILDEPTSQLDPIAASDFLNTVKKLNTEFGITVVIIEHRLEEVFPLADKVMIMENGRITAFDTPKNIGKNLKDNDMFASFPAPVQIYSGLGQSGECPLSIKEGRRWLKEYTDENGTADISFDENNADDRNVQNIIEAKDVWFRYERHGEDIVKGLTMQVKKGELYCVLGGNGTGKSTSLALLSSIKTPYRGKIVIDGRDIKKYRSGELFKGKLAMLPQNPQSLFVMDTVKEDLMEVFSTLKLSEHEKTKRFNSAVEETEIKHLLNAHPYDLSGGEQHDLSGGEQQRAALAKILLINPEIVLLDEPTKGLDGFYKRKLAEIFENGEVKTQQKPRAFFTGNNFYSTAANRMARGICSNAITVEDVIELCRIN